MVAACSIPGLVSSRTWRVAGPFQSVTTGHPKRTRTGDLEIGGAQWPLAGSSPFGKMWHHVTMSVSGFSTWQVFGGKLCCHRYFQTPLLNLKLIYQYISR